MYLLEGKIVSDLGVGKGFLGLKELITTGKKDLINIKSFYLSIVTIKKMKKQVTD